MNGSSAQPRPLSLLAVAVAGFAGGAVFLPALLEKTPVTAAGMMLVAGGMGALLYASLWLLLSAIVSRRYNMDRATFMKRSGSWFAVSLLPLILYFPYLAIRSGLASDSAELPPLASRPTAIILLVWSLLLLAILLRLNFGSQQSRFVDWVERHPKKLLTAMVIIWVVVFYPLDVLKDHYMQVTTVNSALFIESFHNLADERGVMFSNLLFGDGASVLAVHANIILFFLLPFFYVWPDYKMLLLVSDIALALAAVPLFLIARRHFSAAVSLLLSAMLLLHPIYTAQPGRSDFSEMRFMPLLFLAAFYLFEKKRFWAFALTTLLLMTIREDMGLFVAFFGLYALFRRRSLKWVLGPVLWGLAWFTIMFKILIPDLSPSGTSARATLRYAGAAGELIMRPFSTPSHIGVLYGLFITFGLGLPLLSSAVVLAIPVTAEILLQKHTTLVSFMSLPTVPILMVALALGLKRFASFLHERRGLPVGKAAAGVALLIFFVSTSAFHTWFNPGLYTPRYNYDAAVEALDMIPDDAQVMLPEFTLIYGKAGQTVRGYHQIEYQMELEGDFNITEDYLLIDRRMPTETAGTRYYKGLQGVAAYLEASPDFQVEFEKDDLQLYVRRAGRN